MLAPVFEEVSDKFDDKAVFVKLDVDENEDAAMKYGITSIPNVILFKNGKPAANSLGFLARKGSRRFRGKEYLNSEPDEEKTAFSPSREGAVF